MPEAIIWNITMFGTAALFFLIGVYAQKREKPMWFWVGTEVKADKITDVKQYNKENGRMWKQYSVRFLLAGISMIKSIVSLIKMEISFCFAFRQKSSMIRRKWNLKTCRNFQICIFRCANRSKLGFVTKEYTRCIVTTFDDELSRKIEPGAPVSSVRFDVIQKLSDAGIYTGVVMTPLLPFLEDTEENIREMVKRTAGSGAKFLYGIMGVTVRDGQREYFYDGLTRNFPGDGLAERYQKTYGYRYYCASRKAKKLWGIFTEECRNAGLLYDMKDIIHDYKKNYICTQLSLDMF